MPVKCRTMINLDYKTDLDWTADVLYPGGRRRSRRVVSTALLVAFLAVALVAVAVALGVVAG